jgi:GTP-binding protein
MAYFQNSLRRKGVIDELKDMGINEGDIVKLDDIEFEYIE